MKEKRTPKWIIVLIVIFAIIVTILPFIFFAVMIVLDTSTQFKIEKNGSINIDHNRITVLPDVSGNYDEENDCYYIEGVIRNNTKENRNVSITYNLYDKDNVILGTADAYLENLDPKGKWKFKASYCDYAKEVSSFKVTSAESFEY